MTGLKTFNVSLSRILRIIKDFKAEMEKGLAGQKSSLKMIPTYVSMPDGREKGKFVALDIGGTNFRILQLTLKGRGLIGSSNIMKFVLPKKHITGSAEGFFGFIAGCVKAFLKKYKLESENKLDLGFTFSFPVKQTGATGGSLVCWTKDFDVSGVIGNDVVELLREAFLKKDIRNVKIAALANDTVGTLVAKSYEDRSCDVGVIIGTGTNACYPEKLSKIKKLKGFDGGSGEMIINIEWGNFNKLKSTSYDRRLDKSSDNPGRQILEKMVSGMYLGRLAGLLLGERFGLKGEFKTEYMSIIENDESKNLSRTGLILKNVGIKKPSLGDRQYARKACQAVSRRGARISGACIAAIIKKMDPALSENHTVAIDGSVYEKHPTFANNIKFCLKEIFGRRSNHIKIALAKDGSGKGAAIIAAVAASR